MIPFFHYKQTTVKENSMSHNNDLINVVVENLVDLSRLESATRSSNASLSGNER